jgi:hypothetical protein
MLRMQTVIHLAASVRVPFNFEDHALSNGVERHGTTILHGILESSRPTLISIPLYLQKNSN